MNSVSPSARCSSLYFFVNWKLYYQVSGGDGRAEHVLAWRHSHQEANQLALGGCCFVVLPTKETCSEHRAAHGSQEQLRFAACQTLHRQVYVYVKTLFLYLTGDTAHH